MNDAPRQKLREIIQRHGLSIIEDPRRCENLLRDYCGEFRREISVLTMALKEHAVADLFSANGLVPRKVLLARLAQRLCDNLGLSESAAHWSIESWAWALGLISDSEIKANETADAEIASSPAAVPTVQTNQTAATQTAKIIVSNKVLIVSAAGNGDFTTINDALQNAAPNSRLVIRQGIYHESIRLDKNIEILGEGETEKIIVRSTEQSCISMQTEKASVQGLTLQGRGSLSGKAFFAVDIPRGALFLENCQISSDTLSCVAIYGADANPSLKNCRIHDGADSGLYIFDNARAFIENCEVYKNANDNIAVTRGANPTIKNCRIFRGGNGGIVVWGNGAAATVEDCEITNHRLANVGIRQTANPVFRRCQISGGSDCGVFIQENGYGIFEECNIYGNLKAEIAVTDRSRTTVRASNIHQGRESGVFIGNLAQALIENCNIYDNTDAGISVYGESAAVVRRCNINRNGTVALSIRENSRTRVENCDLRGNRIATWETEHGVSVERNNNRE